MTNADTIPRDVLKWLHSLDLSFTIKRPRRDIANGYIVAEILSRYDPRNVPLHSFTNASSLTSKIDNWAYLDKLLKKNGVDLPKEIIDSVVQGTDPAAASFVLKTLFKKFTGKKLVGVELNAAATLSRKPVQDVDGDSVPAYARPTATKLLRDTNNTTAEKFKNLLGRVDEQRQKSQNLAMLQSHVDNISKDKVTNPQRYVPAPRRTDTLAQRGAKALKEIPGPPPAPIQVRTTEEDAVKERLHRAAVQREGRVDTDRLGIKLITESNMSMLLSDIVRTAFRECSERDQLLDADRADVGNSMSVFTAGLNTLSDDVRIFVWSSLFRRASSVADLLLHRPGEFSRLTLALQFVWDAELDTTGPFVQNVDTEKARALIGSVGEETYKMEPAVARHLATEYLLPLCRQALAGRCPHRRGAAALMVKAFCGNSIPETLELIADTFVDRTVRALVTSHLVSSDAEWSARDVDALIHFAAAAVNDSSPIVQACGVYVLRSLVNVGLRDDAREDVLNGLCRDVAEAILVAASSHAASIATELFVQHCLFLKTLLDVTSDVGLQSTGKACVRDLVCRRVHPNRRPALLLSFAAHLDDDATLIDAYVRHLVELPPHVQLQLLTPGALFEVAPRSELPSGWTWGNLIPVLAPEHVVERILVPAAKSGIEALKPMLCAFADHTAWESIQEEGKIAWWRALKAIGPVVVPHLSVVSSPTTSRNGDGEDDPMVATDDGRDSELERAVVTLYLELSGVITEAESETRRLQNAREWYMTTVMSA